MKIVNDAKSLAALQIKSGRSPLLSVLRVVLINDSFHILAMFRMRQFAKRWKIPLVNRILRLVQMAQYGVDLGSDIELGAGVYFVHPVGIVIGGSARLGARVRLMGGGIRLERPVIMVIQLLAMMLLLDAVREFLVR